MIQLFDGSRIRLLDSRSIWSQYIDRSEFLGTTYPKIYIEIPSTAKLSVPNLKSDRHLVILVEGLMKALSAMSSKLDIVRNGSTKQAACR